jgi:Ca2+-binding RTX toxin-like protein
MAAIIGTNGAENLIGTNEDDTIFGLGGADAINGLDGNDTIDGGLGIDDVLGGAGNDTIIATVVEAGEKFDGGDGIDTLVVDLAALDFIKNDGTQGRLANVTSGVFTNNLEFVKVSNASDFSLDLSSNASFGLDTTVTSTSLLNATAATASSATALEVLAYNAADGAVTANKTAVSSATVGVIVDGVTHLAGSSFVTADGGTVAVTYGSGEYFFAYTAVAADIYAVGIAGGTAAGDADDVTGDSIVATVTLLDGSTVDVAVDFNLDLGPNFNASAAAAGITSHGDFQANIMTGSAFDDVIWAGATSGTTDNDTLSGGGGDDILAGGGGVDAIDGEADNDTIYAGSGNDVAVFGGEGDDKIFGGEGDDTLTGDTLTVANAAGTAVGDGNDIIYGGAGDGSDTIYGNGGNDTIYGGAGVDALDGGDGNDTIFNGAGVDAVDGGLGDDVIWGGSGDDTLKGDVGNDTFGFIAGNGIDTVSDFDIASVTAGDGDVLDLTAFGFANTADVIANMTSVNAGADAQLFIDAGQTITFENVTVLQFQNAFDDWVLV